MYILGISTKHVVLTSRESICFVFLVKLKMFKNTGKL